MNLSLGSSGVQVAALQKILNQDSATRVAVTGPGSSGNESTYFGSLTKAAVIRFQEKYASEILSPVGLTRGNGYVGAYTRAKLNTLSTPYTGSASASPSAPVTPSAASPTADYTVKDSEKIDIYAGDAMIAKVQNKMTAAINAAIASQSMATATMPTIALTDVPSSAIKEVSPRSGAPGTRATIAGIGITSQSTLYFGNKYIVRAMSLDIFGNFSFVVPSIPPGRYDIAIREDDRVSNTKMFVITDPQNPRVRLQSISPATTTYGGTLTITGSGFTSTGNIVVTTYQTFADVPSSDGKTLTMTLAPESLREPARVGRGTDKVLMSVSVVNDYGFSDSEKIITMIL